MLNIHDLEKRWLRYKIKSFIPYIITIFLIFSIIGAYSFFTVIKTKKIVEINNIKSTPLPTKQKKQKPIPKPLQKKTNQLKKQNLKNTKKKNDTLKLSPSMNFLTVIQDKKEQQQRKKQTIKKPKQSIKQETKSRPIQKKQISTITIMKQDTTKDIQNILHRFQEERNPALSLFLAKKYYELGDYKKASNYALITNQLNKEIEDSWLIFAKSLVKRGKREKAIQLLRKYINKSHSTNAAILLNNIQSGTFQ